MKNKSIFFFTKEDFTNQVVKKLKNHFLKLLSENNGIINIALSGGNTPLPILEKLKKEKLEWLRLNFFMVDERCVSLNSLACNYTNIKKCFFDEIPSKSYSMIHENLSFESSAIKYSELLEIKLNKKNGIPCFDLILLGMGNDGHTASLFPKTAALNENKRTVVLNEIPQLNTNRITLTYPVLLNSKKIFVLSKGDDKKEIINNIYSNSPKNYPIYKIANEFENLTWLIA